MFNRKGRCDTAALTIATTLILAVITTAQGGELTETPPQTSPPPKESPDTGSQVFDLGTVMVSAPAETGSLELGTTLSEDEIFAIGATSLTEALDWVPGVNIGQVGARNEGQVYVRGLDLRQVPVFVDGIPIYVPYDGYMDVSRLTLADVSQITVDKGFSSILYGPNTMGGAINVVTQKPTRPFEGSIGGGLQLDASGDVPLVQEHLTLGSKSDRFYAIGTVSNVKRNFFTLPDSFDSTAVEDGDRRANSDTEDLRIMTRLGFTPNDTDDYSITYALRDASKDVPPYTGTYTAPRYWTYPEWREHSLYYLSRTQFNRMTLKLRAFYEQMDNTLESYDDDSYTTQTKGYAFTSIYEDYSYGASAELAYDLSDTSVLTGAIHFKDDVHRQHDEGEPRVQQEDRTWSVGTEYTSEPIDRLTVTLGLRYDIRESIQAEEYQNGAISEFDTDDMTSWNWQGGVVYRIFDNLSLHATYSRTTRLPTLKDRYSRRLGKSLANPYLDSEASDNYEIGVRGKPADWLEMESAVFYSDTDDMIQAVDITPALYQMQNVGNVRTLGWELGGKATLSETVAIGGAYTLLDRENRTDSSVKLTDVPEHHLNLYVSWTPVTSLEIRPGLRAQSQTYSSSDGAQKTDGFAVADLTFLYDLNKDLSFQFGVWNLGDTEYEYDEGFPEAGRTLFVNAKYTF